MAKVHIKLQAARLKAINIAPYLATALWSVHPVETDMVPTMGVDKYWRLYYNPEILDEWTPEETAGVVIHEIWHLLRKHSQRAEIQGIKSDKPTMEMMAKALIWNLAADCEINDDLLSEKISLPSGSIKPKDFGLEVSQLAEYYYNKLLKNMKCVKCGGGFGGSGDGENQSKSSGKQCKCERGGEAGNDGSGVTGIPAEWEMPCNDKGDSNAPQTSQGEGDLIARQTADDIASKHAGKVPGHAKRWASTYLHPKVDWRRQLSGAIRSAMNWASGRVDYSYRRPSRRQSIYGRVVMPSMVAPNPEATIVIDTSGSMGQNELNTCLAETKGILDAIAGKVTIYIVDYEIHKKQSVYRIEDVELIGGGGTDMRKGIAQADADKTPICIVLTDGYTPWPHERPKHIGKVIICLIASSKYGSKKDTPSWATVIEVNCDD